MILKATNQKKTVDGNMRPQTIEQTSKPIKLWLALSSIAFFISFIGMVVSFGNPAMSTKSWFYATCIALVVHQVCRAARWWENG